MPRKEIFDLKNSEGQARFFLETENNTTKELAGKKGDSEDEYKMFMQLFDKSLQKCFTKIRVKNQYKEHKKVYGSDINTKLMSKIRMSTFLSTTRCKLAQEMIKHKIDQIDEEVSKLLSQRHVQTILEYTSNLGDPSGKFSHCLCGNLEVR